jgi:hypothetical protein
VSFGGTVTAPDPTALQQALFPFAAAMEMAADLDERELDTFLFIAATRIAREANRLRWWQT